MLRLRKKMRNFMKDHDLIICPVTAGPPPKVPGPDSTGEVDVQDLSFAYLKNLAGLPAMSVPVGFDNQGLPVSVQIIAGPNQEHKLLAAAREIEKQARFREQAAARLQ
jgi:amidase